MTEYLRLKDPVTGDEFTYDIAKIEALGLEAYIIDKPALGRNGLPAPTKPNVPLGEALPGSEQDQRHQAEQQAATDAAALAQWTAHAESLGIDVPDDATIDQIVELVEEHTPPNQTPGAPDPGQEAGQPSADTPKEH